MYPFVSHILVHAMLARGGVSGRCPDWLLVRRQQGLTCRAGL